MLSPAERGAAPQQAPPSQSELKKLTVAELMDVNVTSVSKAAERRDQAAAAVTVVTSEDITRSGATSVPDALRLVPGIHVARQSSSIWAVSSRGFSSINSEKLLVLNDTRSMYTPLFSGVFWDVQNFVLEDIDRIEVIRGPGATLWGSNAVNGVINITTKAASETQGGVISASVGSEEQVSMTARYGGRWSDRAHYRVFAKYVDRDATAHASPDSSDGWQTGQAGFRADWTPNPQDTFTLQSDVYRGDIGQLSPIVVVQDREGPTGKLRVRTAGGNVLGRWRRSASPAAGFELRAYYERSHRNDPSFTDDLDTVDVDVQHRFTPHARHVITWGANYLLTANDNAGKGIFAVDPGRSNDHLVGGFIQDHLRLTDTVQVTIGTKLEHNDFSGGELQPGARVGWDVSRQHFVWASVARAVRAPTRLERDLAIDVNQIAQVRLLGNPDFEAERLVAYEGGYRWQPLQSLSFDVAAFHNRYSGLAALGLTESFPDPVTGRPVFPLRFLNLNTGRTGGIEALVTYAPIPSSRLTASYSYLDMSLETAGEDLNRETFLDGATPRHQFGVRSSLDLPSAVQLDALFRHLSAIRRLPQITADPGLPGYSELDVRLAWKATRHLTLSVVGQNLLHGRHVEFGPPEMRGDIQRGVYTRIAWGF